MRKKVNIVFLSRLYSPHIGGVERHVKGICRVLSRKHQIKIVTQKHDPMLKDYEKIDGIEVYRISANSKREIWSWFKKNKHILDWANVIHAHDVYFWIIPYRLRHPRKKTFVTFHGWEGKYPVPIKNILVRKLSEFLARGNICIGDFISKWYFTKPTDVSYGAA